MNLFKLAAKKLAVRLEIRNYKSMSPEQLMVEGVWAERMAEDDVAEWERSAASFRTIKCQFESKLALAIEPLQ